MKTANFHMKITSFHENRTKDHLQGIVTPMFNSCY